MLGRKLLLPRVQLEAPADVQAGTQTTPPHTKTTDLRRRRVPYSMHQVTLSCVEPSQQLGLPEAHYTEVIHKLETDKKLLEKQVFLMQTANLDLLKEIERLRSVTQQQQAELKNLNPSNAPRRQCSGSRISRPRPGRTASFG